MNHVKKALARTAQFVSANKVPITIVATGVTTLVIAKKVYGTAYGAAEQFIAEHNLSEEFINYIPTKN